MPYSSTEFRKVYIVAFYQSTHRSTSSRLRDSPVLIRVNVRAACFLHFDLRFPRATFSVSATVVDGEEYEVIIRGGIVFTKVRPPTGYRLQFLASQNRRKALQVKIDRSV